MRYIFFIYITLTTILLSAQKEWTLEECINYAIDHNIQIKQQALDIEYTENNLQTTKYSQLPTLNANINNNYSWGRSVDPYTNDFTTNNINSLNLGVSSNLLIFNGFQTRNTIKQNEFSLLAKLQNLEKLKNDISLNIAASYLQILLNKEMLESAQNQLNATMLQVERIKKLVDAGSLPEGDYLEIEAQAASDELNVINYQNQLNISYITLIQLLELDTVKNFDIYIPDLSNFEPIAISTSTDYIYEQAVANLPEIKSAEYTLKSAEKGLSVAKGARSPRLSLTASWGSGYSSSYQSYTIDSTNYTLGITGFTTIGTETYYVYSPQFSYVTETTPFFDQFENNLNTSIGFNLTIPIFNGFSVSKSISNAKINILNAQYSLDLTKKQLYKDIQQKYADVIAAMKTYEATKKALIAMEKSFFYQKEKYEVGLINFVDYNNANQNVIKAKSDLIRSKYDYIFKMKILDFYVGKPIKL